MTPSHVTRMKQDKRSGRRAYSDAPGHVLVRLHQSEHGMDLIEARQLLTDLERALAIAAVSDPR